METSNLLRRLRTAMLRYNVSACGNEIPNKIVLDTNVFIAANFKRKSSSGRIVELVKQGILGVPWNQETRREIEGVVRQIPAVREAILDGVFQERHECPGENDPEPFNYVTDPADRKFAALAVAAAAPLITSDDDLLRWRDRIETLVLTPGEFMRRYDEVWIWEAE